MKVYLVITVERDNCGMLIDVQVVKVFKDYKDACSFILKHKRSSQCTIEYEIEAHEVE